MPRETELLGHIVKDYLQRFPKTPNLSLAKLIYKENKPVFNSVEHARDVVRYYRGASGSSNRNRAGLLAPTTPPPRVFKIPESDNPVYEEYFIPENLHRGILLPDIHFPYHDKTALTITMEHAVKSNPDFIVFTGDTIDFHKLSVFQKDPRKRNIKEELDMFREFMKELESFFPDTRIIFKVGNHEERYDNYIMQHAAELFHLDEVHFKSILNFQDENYVDKKRVIRFSSLNIIHGHEYKFNISNPVNPARGIFLRTKKSTVAGHFHQSSEHSETTINGDLITCWSMGCLCGLHPEWLPLNKWNHGFAEIVQETDEYWRLENKRIIGGKIL